jgi:hypothetical protein
MPRFWLMPLSGHPMGDPSFPPVIAARQSLRRHLRTIASVLLIATALTAAGAPVAMARVVVGGFVGLPLLIGPPPLYPLPPPPVYYAPPPVYYYPPPVRLVPSAPPATALGQASGCREYQTTTTIDGRPQRSYGTACRQPDGTWRIMN